MGVSVHNPDKTTISAGPGIIITGDANTGYVIEATAGNQIKWAGLIELTHFVVCDKVPEPYRICCENFEEDDVIVVTGYQEFEEDNPLCSYVFYMANMQQVEENYCAFIYAYSDCDTCRKAYVIISKKQDC